MGWINVWERPGYGQALQFFAFVIRMFVVRPQTREQNEYGVPHGGYIDTFIHITSNVFSWITKVSTKAIIIILFVSKGELLVSMRARAFAPQKDGLELRTYYSIRNIFVWLDSILDRQHYSAEEGKMVREIMAHTFEESERDCFFCFARTMSFKMTFPASVIKN